MAIRVTASNVQSEYDFGARYYYSAVPHFTNPDPLCEKRPDLSTYLYCANNPVNAFDPDGKIVIFVNGMHFGDGGKEKYWKGVDVQIMNIVGDNLAQYIDGSLGGYKGLVNSQDLKTSNLNVEDRISAGFESGYENCQQIIDVANATKSSVKFVTHSMGSAFTKGSFLLLQFLIVPFLISSPSKKQRILKKKSAQNLASHKKKY